MPGVMQPTFVDNVAIVNETTKEKGMMFVSILFKLCDEVTIMPKDETYKQLAILLVDLVSPDVMYNGLPWPEEEFTRYELLRKKLLNFY